tara:strand:- start:407 stop:628 length:222 start_codon:yes stop_codon:yes gene_type:complete
VCGPPAHHPAPHPNDEEDEKIAEAVIRRSKTAITAIMLHSASGIEENDISQFKSKEQTEYRQKSDQAGKMHTK